MICWSCEKSAGAEMFCASCGALQPPVLNANHFEVLGLPQRFDLDPTEMERHFKERTRQLHPDRFARADARARRASLSRSVQLNQAWKTLRDPVRRAEYLLSLSGIEVGGEEGTQRASSSAPGGKERIPVPQGLLIEVMELRESLADARASEDDDQVRTLTADVTARKATAMARVAATLDAPTADLEAAARDLVAVRYFDRFLEEVAVHEEADAVRAEGQHRSTSTAENPDG